jgi:hypothetical protein
MKEFKSWKDIKEWAEENGFEKLAKRLQLNNDCWNSCGEFGRSQVAICDSIRYAETEEERLEVAGEIEKELTGDIVELV